MNHILKTGWVALALLACCCDYNEHISGTETGNSDLIIYYVQEHETAVTLPFGPGSYTILDELLKECACFDLEKGEADLTCTYAGIKYPILFEKGNTKKYFTLLISGVRYPNSEFKISDNAAYIVPIYNADPNAAVPPGSKFDTPPPGEQALASQGLVINTTTGAIDITKSLANGVMGSKPKHGDKRHFKLYYQLNDKSNFALNYTHFVLEFSSSNREENGRFAAEGRQCRDTAIVIKSN